MFTALAASAAVLITPMQEPEPYVNQWVCGASAEAWNGAVVDVIVHVTGDGSRLDESASWQPPRTGEVRPRNVNLTAPTLSLNYDRPLQSPLGTPSAIWASVTSDGGPPTILEGLNLLLFVDDNAPITGRNPFTEWGQPAEEPPLTGWGLTHRYATVQFEQDGLMTRLASARSARLILVDAEGRLLAETRYDLSATAQRDQLFEEARVKATESLRVPRACDPTVGNTEAFPPERS